MSAQPVGPDTLHLLGLARQDMTACGKDLLRRAWTIDTSAVTCATCIGALDATLIESTPATQAPPPQCKSRGDWYACQRPATRVKEGDEFTLCLACYQWLLRQGQIRTREVPTLGANKVVLKTEVPAELAAAFELVVPEGERAQVLRGLVQSYVGRRQRAAEKRKAKRLALTAVDSTAA